MPLVKVEGKVPKAFVDDYGDLLGFVDFAEKNLDVEKRWGRLLREVDLRQVI